jgi:hypothetical protein
MKKYLTMSITFVLFLTGCSSPSKNNNDTHASDAPQSSTISETFDHKVTVNDAEFNLSFLHPQTWGQWMLTQMPSQPNTDALAEMSFSELDRTIQYPQTGRTDINITFRRYDEAKYRYEEVCDERSIDLCDTMKQQDLLAEKDAFMKNATQIIGGTSAVIRDFYDVPSGYLARQAQFYTPSHRVHFSAIYDIGDFLFKQSPTDASLFDTAKRILGTELSDPINRLSTMYPEDLEDMTRFYQDIDKLLKSLKVVQE